MSQDNNVTPTIKPATDLTVHTSTASLTGNALPIFSKVGGDASAFDGSALKTILDKGEEAHDRVVLISEDDYQELVNDDDVDPNKIYLVYESPET